MVGEVARLQGEEVLAGGGVGARGRGMGSGDGKYRTDAPCEYVTRSGTKINIHLVSNPSHLEAVDPVTVGRTRAKQDRAGEDGSRKFLPLLVHGDAAFAGQGIVAETLNMSDLTGYTVGGQVNTIANNPLGCTPPHRVHPRTQRT